MSQQHKKHVNPLLWATAFAIVAVFAAISYRIFTSCEAASFEALKQLKVSLGGCQIEKTKARGTNDNPTEQRFDLVVNNAPASQVFMAMAFGTRYNIVVHRNVKGNLSIKLKDVTVLEALNAVREMYGYEYKIEGNLIFIQPLTMDKSTP
jgi:type II secretory pathway component HofQ